MEVTIDPKSWHQLSVELKAFEPALALSLRRRIKKAGNEAVKAVKTSLSGGYVDTYGARVIRPGLAAGTRTSVSFRSRTAGVKIVTSGNRLPAGKSPMVKAWNKASFRHPVFGGHGWATQQGHPYFGSVIVPMQGKIRADILDALDDAMKAIGAR